jgi:hypothetical protein
MPPFLNYRVLIAFFLALLLFLLRSVEMGVGAIFPNCMDMSVDMNPCILNLIHLIYLIHLPHTCHSINTCANFMHGYPI